MYQKNLPNRCFENNNSIGRIWWMNIGVPETISVKTDNFFPSFNNKKQSIITATEQLCLYQAYENDIVVLRTKPTDEVLNCVKAVKGFLPVIFYVEDKFENLSESIVNDRVLLSSIKKLLERKTLLYILTPFKVTKFDVLISKILGVELCGNIPNEEFDINDKIIARQISNKLSGNIVEGYECYSINDVEYAINTLFPIGPVVVKEHNGISGKGLYLINNNQSYNTFNIFLRRHKKEQKFRLLVEKWYSDCISINYQIYIGKDGEIRQLYPTIQLVNSGVYVGTEAQTEDYLSEEDMDEIYSFGKKLARTVYEKGYYGNLSIDAIKIKEKLIHLVEINARFSLSSYYFTMIERYFDKKLVIQYYNVNTSRFFIHEFYDKFCKITDKSGVVILSYGENQPEESGRIFVLFFAETVEDLKLMRLEVEGYIKER